MTLESITRRETTLQCPDSHVTYSMRGVVEVPRWSTKPRHSRIPVRVGGRRRLPFGAQRHTRDETRRPACVVVETALRTPLGPGDKT